MDSIGLRLQQLEKRKQALVLACIAEARSVSGRFGPSAIVELFDEVGLPRPAKMSNVFGSLEKEELLSRTAGKGDVWRVSPKGKDVAGKTFSELEVSEFLAETVRSEGTKLGETRHPLVPYTLAPPELSLPLGKFLASHPFDLNVFGMTRYPEEGEGTDDPIGPALAITRNVCEMHGLTFHLASDRIISEDLWANIAGHMWGSRYGIGFFENRKEEGLNPNLAIEIGSMLMTGRRCALLKDDSIDKMPTDLVGKIYKSVNLKDPATVGVQIHSWIREDLGLGACTEC